jgi:hypothetical protein
MKIDTSAWTKFATTSNADFYEIEPHVLVVVPFDGTTDDAGTAQESVAAQLKYLQSRGQRAGVIVLMDQVVRQDGAARAVYHDQPDPAFQVCFALVGSTPFGRAVSSIFIGLNPPRVPTRFFATIEEALAWIKTALKSH